MAQGPPAAQRKANDNRGLSQPIPYFFRDFGGVNTQAHRTAIRDNQFSWLENVMPVGPGNLRSIPAQSATLATLAATPVQSWHMNLNGAEYELSQCSDGSIQQTLLTSPYTTATVAAAGTLSASGAWAAQWKNTNALFIDPVKGYFSWDGTTFLANGNAASIDFTNGGYVGGTGYLVGDVLTLVGGSPGTGAKATVTAIDGSGGVTAANVTTLGSGYTANYLSVIVTGTGAGAKLYVQIMSGPTAGTSIAVFQGRAWIANGRLISFSAPNSFNDFLVSDSGGQFTMIDPTLEDTVQALLTANNYLYIVGKTGFNVLSDVRVVSGVTQFTNVNVEASIGTANQAALFPYYRAILFFNSTGAYSLLGSTPQKISDELDGIVPLIDFSKPITGGTVSILNILCAAFCFTYNDPVRGPRQLLAINFANKWFFASQGDVSAVFSSNVGTVQTLYGMIGSNLVQLFQNADANIDQIWQTKLWDFGDAITVKQLMRLGFYATIPTGANASITVMEDSEFESNNLTLTTSKTITFVGSSAITFVGTGPINWTGSGLIFFDSDAGQFGAFLGFTFTTSNPGLKFIVFMFDYFKRTRWGATP